MNLFGQRIPGSHRYQAMPTIQVPQAESLVRRVHGVDRLGSPLLVCTTMAGVLLDIPPFPGAGSPDIETHSGVACFDQVITVGGRLKIPMLTIAVVTDLSFCIVTAGKTAILDIHAPTWCIDRLHFIGGGLALCRQTCECNHQSSNT
jgi:hypothetical protein